MEILTSQFGLLMWKHYHLRKYKWFMTGVEILLPIIMAYLLCSNGGKILIGPAKDHNDTIGPVYDSINYLDALSSVRLVYAPANKFTNKIIEKVTQYTSIILVKAVDDEQKLEKFVSSNNNESSEHRWIGIFFLDTDSNIDKPSRFHYKIRDTNSWRTDSLYYESSNPGPFTEDPYYAKGFAGLQIIVDTAFIQLWNPTFDYEKVYFQPFPYPEYKEINPLRSMAPGFVCLVVIITSLMLSVPLIGSIIEEKETGVKELMKLSGVKEWLVQVSWFVNAFMFSLISFTVVTYLLQKEFSGPGSAILLKVPALIVWTSIILYCISNIAFCFTFSAIFHNITVASSIFTLAFCILLYAVTKVDELHLLPLMKLSCLFPVGAFYQGFQRISYFENHEQSVSWDTLKSGEISLLFVFVMLVFDTFLYLLFSYYITAINPGTFGVRKSALFFIEKLRSAAWPDRYDERLELDDGEPDKYFEKPPQSLKIGIRMKNLHKHFDSVFAVRGVNLNVYQGEITALLGHNGAGKTTTMAILTGMVEPSTGSIMYKDSLDVLKKMDVFRQYLGLCPQENRLFPYFSVINHLLFFGMLKGASKKSAREEANEYLSLMEMSSKANDLSKSLSGGMQRKLCLAIALMGKVQTLILDEPTSGLDVESRRKVWDLLLEMRGNRTIILSTHHMEEADVLGDRIAIMNHGKIVCHGTPLFLKKTYGTGYQVTISKHKNNEAIVTNTIKSIVPSAEKENESAFEIIYKLPLTETHKFSELFNKLEEQKLELGIENIGVACTTMEKVFLKVGQVSVYNSSKTSVDGSSISNENLLSEYSERKKTGLPLLLQQLGALFFKKFLFMKGNVTKFFSRVLLPTLILALILRNADLASKPEPPITLTLSTYPNAEIMLTNKRSDESSLFNSTVNYVQKQGASILFSNENIVDGLLDFGRKSLDTFRKGLVLAASYNSTNNLTLYNPFALHSLPILINTISNVELKLFPENSISIKAINHPVQIEKESCDPNRNLAHIILMFLALAFYSIDLGNYFSIFLSLERIDGFKHVQLMSNVSPLVYWISNFIFDFAFFFIIVFMRILLFKAVDDSNGFLTFHYPFDIFLLLLCLFIPGELLFTYVVNFLSKSKDGSYSLLLIMNFAAGIIAIVFYFIQWFNIIRPEDNSEAFPFPTSLYYFLKYLVLFVPMLNYSLAFIKFSMIWSNNIVAKKAVCEGNTKKEQEYLVFASRENPNGLLEEVIFMIVDILLYSTLLFLTEAGYFNWLANKVLSKLVEGSVKQINTADVDPDVVLERNLVHSHTFQSSENRTDAILVAQGLQKVFIKMGPPFVAVEDVNFTVKSGECFGLLGTNGAGKSTCFKMLTGALLPTKGDSFIQNIRLSKNRSKYLSSAGYCAQTNGFIEEMSGREMLTLIATLRGVPSSQLKAIVDKWISILGLEIYQHQKCGQYSGGNKRKLCTAMSLIGDPHVVFLDEPTTGVDPVSRRKLYDVMEQSKLSGQAVVLTSHSMEECENLCDRITIMTRGQMKCIGTAHHLKQRFAQGFSILIKTRESLDEEAYITTLKNNVKRVLGENLCILKDEHKGLLYYQIKDVRLKWSYLFETLENLKHENEIVEDYTITDSSLEEVFMSFATKVDSYDRNRD